MFEAKRGGMARRWRWNGEQGEKEVVAGRRGIHHTALHSWFIFKKCEMPIGETLL